MIRHVLGFFTGILINLQFFTSIPVKKQLPLDRFHLTYSLKTFAILGLLQGAMYAGLLFLLQSYTPFSTLLIAWCLWLVLILLSGGIHLDGWIDTSDAYFSYQDMDKRLEIMQDPRVGAFGVLSIIVFLGTRFLILFELVTLANGWTYFIVGLIPFLGKIYMGACIHILPSAREQGMAKFFQQGVNKGFWLVNGFYIIVIGIIIGLVKMNLLTAYAILLLVMILVAFVFMKKITKSFGGITGDILGASAEGMELLLWITVLLLHYFAMV